MIATICMVMLGLAMLGTLYRLMRGPTLADRILGLDMLTILAVAFIAAFAIHTSLWLYIDLAVAVALVGLLATLAFARYLLTKGQT